MENNTKILIGVGVAIVAYLIFKPKKATGEAIIGDSYSDEDLCCLIDYWTSVDTIQETDPRYILIKEKFSKKSIQDYFEKEKQPEKAAFLLEQIKDLLTVNRAVNSDLAKITPQQFMNCIKSGDVQQKELFKNGFSYSIAKEFIKKMTQSNPSKKLNNQIVCKSIQGALREATSIIMSCNPSLMPNYPKALEQKINSNYIKELKQRTNNTKEEPKPIISGQRSK